MLYMYLDDDQAIAQRSTSPTYASNIDHNVSYLLQVNCPRLQVEMFLKRLLAFLLRLTIVSFTLVLVTYIIDEMKFQLLSSHPHVEQDIGCFDARGCRGI